jgi:O-antigen/teichoic acid export membrane protein
MHQRPAQPGRQTMGGTLLVFLAEALVLPTGMLIAAFMTRRLGPEGYGLFTLAATLVAWIEWSIASMFVRATVKFIGEADDWRPVAAAVFRLHLLVSVGAAALLWLLAVPVAEVMGEPSLVTYMRLFALDIPLFSLARAQQSVLVGIGSFGVRALASAGRWITRLALIVVLVELGLSVTGAILGSIGASLIELAIGCFYVRPLPFSRFTFPLRPFWEYAAPLFLFALSLRLYDRLDLFALKALGGTAEQAGIYGAAQTVALVPGIFALSFSPLVLSTLSRTLRAGDTRQAKEIGRNAMRLVVGLLAFIGLAAGAAVEIVDWVFGAAFLAAAPLLALLFFGALALLMISVTTAILTAVGRPGLTFALTGPLLPLVLVCQLVLIPAHGAIGAATATALVAGLGAVATVVAVFWIWRIVPPAGTLGRAVLACGLAYALAVVWPAPGLLLLAKLPTIAVVVCLTFVALGELTGDELRLVGALLRRPGAILSRRMTSTRAEREV